MTSRPSDIVARLADGVGRLTRDRLPAGSAIGDGMRTLRDRLPRRMPERPIGQVIFTYAQHQPQAFVIQIGAHDGRALDPLRQELVRRPWRGILVEPVPYVFERLEATYRRYPRLILENTLGRNPYGLVEKLGEDGAFGCWCYDYEGRPRCSRDLLDAVNELMFLDRHLAVLNVEGLRVVDVGAGYGRLAHRFAQAVPGLADYCCLDAVPTSTFLCEWYTRYRGVSPPVRAVPLPNVPELATGSFDLACNVHCWSECTGEVIAWWAEELAPLRVPRLFVVPNEPEGFLSFEEDGSRNDYLGTLQSAGYQLVVDEPVIADPAVRSLLQIHDRHCLFELAG